VSDRAVAVAALHSARPRSRFLCWSSVGVGLLVAWAWWAGSFDVVDLFSERRQQNLERFLG